MPPVREFDTPPAPRRCAEVSDCVAVARVSLLLCLALLIATAGCDGCRRGGEERARERRQRLEVPRCTQPADCGDGGVCNFMDCVNEKCVSLPAPADTACDNDTVCDGVARCDGKGRCVAGRPPAVDDGNACTTDACDPVTGVSHEAVVIDDEDVCTEDACDLRTGQITHTSVNVEDGDDCTRDSCDPKTGVQHQAASAYSSCDSGCRSGFHVAARSLAAECGSAVAVRTSCAPSCGGSFHACAVTCPPGYHSAARSTNPRCGKAAPEQVFCQKTDADSFHTCDEGCPPGYTLRSQAKGGQCGSRAVMAFCAKG